jgi:antirestriction protein ArdC
MSTYEVITQRVIEAIQKTGNLPWRKPWHSKSIGSLPFNITSKKPYRGINVFLLSMMGFSSPYWLTFKQANALGGSIRRGEKGCPVVFWSVLEKKNPKTNEIEKIPFIRHTSVFNIEQCDNIEIPTTPIPLPSPANPIEECELIALGFNNAPRIVHQEQQAYYSPTKDIVNMPIRDSFGVRRNTTAHYFTS